MPQLAIVETRPAEPDPLAEAVAAVRAVHRRIEGLRATRDRLSQILSEETAVLAEIGEIGSREVELFRAWAAAGASGDAPSILSAERKALAERLALAQAKASGVESAISGIDAQIFDLSSEARELSAAVDVAVFEKLIDDYGARIDACAAAFVAARQKAAEVFGLRRALAERAHAMRGEGKDELGRSLLRRLEPLIVPDPEAAGTPTVGEVNAAQEHATARIRQLSEVAQ